MTIAIEAGVNLTGVPRSISVTDVGGSDIITIAGTTYGHRSMQTVTGGYAALATTIQTDLNASGTLSETYTVTYDPFAVSAYTISATGSFEFTAVSSGMAELLGFDASTSPGTSASSVRTPTYLIIAEVAGLSSDSEVYEADGITTGAISEDGTPFAVSVENAPLLRDFTVPFEPYAKTHAAQATASVPWTWQAFFPAVRGEVPFTLWNGTLGTVHVLRPDGTSFRPAPVQTDWHGLWNVDLLTYQLGSAG